jgi:hypothetical protein
MATKKYKEDFILLAEAGFIAVNQADEDSALKLFRAAAILDPKNILPKIGFGYLHLHKLELEVDPNNDMAKAFMGLCLSMMPNSIEKGEKILEQTLKSKDPDIKKMSGSAIDFVEKFIKKTPGPASKGK